MIWSFWRNWTSWAMRKWERFRWVNGRLGKRYICLVLKTALTNWDRFIIKTTSDSAGEFQNVCWFIRIGSYSVATYSNHFQCLICFNIIAITLNHSEHKQWHSIDWHDCRISVWGFPPIQLENLAPKKTETNMIYMSIARIVSIQIQLSKSKAS